MRDVSGREPLALRACEQFREMIQLRVYAFMPLAAAIQDAIPMIIDISGSSDRRKYICITGVYDREKALTINY